MAVKRVVSRLLVAVALSAVATLGAAVSAQGSAWSPAAGMGSARSNHTATLLDDGRVLVAGGGNANGLAGAETYDGQTNRWSFGGAMVTPRTGHTATRLADGQVLVTGGFGQGAVLTSAELYRPLSNTWSPARAMVFARYLHTSTLLADGRVLVAGGRLVNDWTTELTELYDAQTNTWSHVAAMSTPRERHTATLLEDGRVLVAGGDAPPGGGSSSAELYDPRTNAWSPAGMMTTARIGHTATLLADGRVLVAGGFGAGALLSTAEVYDPATNTWSPAGAMAEPRLGQTATLLSDGRVVVAGGNGAGARLPTAEVYDPRTNAWLAAGAMTEARDGHTATLLSDGRVLVAGGGTSSASGYWTALSSAELFTPPGAAVTVDPVSFGPQITGTTSAVAFAVVRNGGREPLTVVAAAIAGRNADDFELTSNTCASAAVAVDGTCLIGLRFTPHGDGGRQATLKLTANTLPETTSVLLTGTGTPAADTGGPAPSVTPEATGAVQTPASVTATVATTPVGRTASTGSRSPEGRPARAVQTTCKLVTAPRRQAVRCTVRFAARVTQVMRLQARLVRGRVTVARTTSTARGANATVVLRPRRGLRAGRYTAVIAFAGTEVRRIVRVP